jgi:PAS domain S-box-containing protein
MGTNRIENRPNLGTTSEKSARTADLFHLLGADCQKNIHIIIQQTLTIIQGACAIYIPGNTRSGEPLVHHNPNISTPPDPDLFSQSLLFKDRFTTDREAHFFLSSILSGDREATDPLVKNLGIKSCIGTPVSYKQKTLGSLWVIDCKPRSFDTDDITCIQTLAAALALEEERFSHETKIQIEKDRFEGFYDASFEAIFLSKGGICMDQNKTALHMFGYSRREAIGKPGTDWIFPRDRERVEKMMLSGKTLPYEITALRKDGTTFPAQIQARMIDHGGEQLRVTALRNISQLIQSQKALVEEKERYKTLIDNISDSVYILQDGQIKFANPKAIELSGYTQADLPGIPFLEMVHPDDREEVLRKHRKRLKGETANAPYSFRVFNKQKETIWVQANGVRILWEKKPAVLGCLRDISKTKELKEKLSQARKLELIGVIAGEVAHDLNNILAGIVSYPELVLMQLEKDSPLIEPISFIHETGLEAAAIVQDLLTLTRRRIHQSSPINLNHVIQCYCDSSAHHILGKNFPEIHLKIDLDPSLLNLNGSEFHLSKMVMNLAINAAEAIGKHGQIIIETFNRHVDVPMDRDKIPPGEYVVLRVKDDGEGINQTDIKRIFEPFYTKKQMGRSGSGLGLSVVWNAVKDHRGYIDVSSQKEKGTCFELYFPATHNKIVTIPDDFKVDDFKGDKENVLVVDDIKGQRKIATECLKSLNYIPYTVDSGKNALAFLQRHPMDILILDMEMEPGINGLETYREALKINPTQRAIITSGFPENEWRKKAKLLGIDQYIKKPYTLQDLACALKKELAPNPQKSC